MKEFKKVCRLAKYGWQFRSSIILFLCFYLFCVLIWIFSSNLGNNYWKGWSFFCIMLGLLEPLILYPTILSLTASNLVQSSPYKKKIQCVYSTGAGLFVSFFFNTIICIILWFMRGRLSAESIQVLYSGLFCIGIIFLYGSVISVLISKGFRFILLHLVIYLVICVLIVDGNASIHFHLSRVSCVIIMYVCMIAGRYLGRLLAECFYKKDLSPHYFMGMLKTK